VSPRAASLGCLIALVSSSCAEMIDPPNDDAGPGSQMMVPQPRAPDCLRLPEMLDFGEVERGRRADLSFVLNNNTLKAIAIDVGAVDAPFSTNVTGPQSVPSGRPLQLMFTFQPPDGRLHVTTMTFSGGAGCAPQQLSLIGIGAGEVLAPSFFDLGPVPVGVRVAKRMTITNSRREAVNLAIINNDGSTFTLDRTSLTIPALGAADVEVSLTAPTVGSFNGSLQISSDHSDRLFVGLAASGGVPDLRSDRPAVRIERLPMSNDPVAFPLLQRNLSLTNFGDGAARIDNVSVRAASGSAVDEVHVVLFNNFLMPGGSTSLLVQLQPRRVTGPRTWVLQIATNQPNLPVLEIPITAEVVSVPDCTGAVFASPVSLTVPAMMLPTTGSITLHNPSASLCLLDDLRFTPALWQLTPAIDQVLLPANGEVVVEFALDQVGASTLIFNPVGADLGYSTVPVRAQ
jgi:hypothetical protein